MTMKVRAVASLRRTLGRIFFVLPLVPAVVLLVSLVSLILPEQPLTHLFGHTPPIDAVIGAGIGSLGLGNPLMGYLVAGELQGSAVDAASTTAFIVAWATVGLSMLPFEMKAFGRRFALARNTVAFLSSIIVGFLTAALLTLF